MAERPVPRARLLKENGEEEDVSDRLVGAQEYFNAWASDVDVPHLQQASGWQRTDDAHPPDTGKPAYRVVFKTLRMIPFPAVEMKWPNLRVTFYCGDVERGGIRFNDTIPGRRLDQEVIPEHGRILDDGRGNITYMNCPNLHFKIQGWEETVKAISALEVIWVAEDPIEDYAALLEAGRVAVGPLLTMLEFEFGPRLLSTRLTEEAGTTFDDWHWNRRLTTGTVYAESQAAFLRQGGQEFISRFQPLYDRHQDLPAEERARLRLASRWYWSVQEEADTALGFLQWWLIIESLEMPKSTDVRPVKTRLSELLSCDPSVVSETVGRLFGLRSKLVHGEAREVPTDRLRAVEVVARLLLADRAGASAVKERLAAKELFGLK
jgi:hypothetical protein